MILLFGNITRFDNTRESSDSRLFILENRGFYISAHVLLNVFNELRNRDEIWGLQSLFLNNIGARMLDDIKITLQSHFWRKSHNVRNVGMDVISYI